VCRLHVAVAIRYASQYKGNSEVETKNFVLNRWVPKGTNGVSGATGYQGSYDPVAGFPLGKEERSPRRS